MKKKIIKTLKISLLVGICFCIVVIVGARLLIVEAAEGRTTSEVSHIPHRPAGLLLGCVEFVPSGGENLFFRHRIDAAVTLYRHQKIDVIIVSGDNHRKDYDEATDMKNALMRQGVPEDKIFCDYAGFRTLDSVVRAKDIFGQTNITVISQEFHNQRAIYIAWQKGMDAIGFNAKGVSRRYSLRTMAREQLARVRTVSDIVFGVHPKFYGERIPIP